MESDRGMQEGGAVEAGTRVFEFEFDILSK